MPRSYKSLARRKERNDMFYKLIVDEQGNIEVVDRVDHAKKK